MRKFFQLMFLMYSSLLLSQTVLSSYPIDYNTASKNSQKINNDYVSNGNELIFTANPNQNYDLINDQILNFENEKTHELFVFLKNKEKITVLKYNSALFLKSASSFLLKNLEDKQILGCSFGDDGNPRLFLSPNMSDNSLPFVIISSLRCDLEEKAHSITNFKFPVTEFLISTFQMNNTFHILAQDKITPVLIVYSFQNNQELKKVYDFSSFNFDFKNGRILNFNQLTNVYPIEKISFDDYNPLDKTAHKSKFYFEKNHIILTLDYDNTATRAFELNLENLELTEKIFEQATVEGVNKIANSFYQDGKLYQVTATQSEIILGVKDFVSREILKTTSILKEDDTGFDSAPMFIQRDSRRPKEIKKPKSFLRQLNSLDIALSVFMNSQNTRVALGGVPRINNDRGRMLSSMLYKNTMYGDELFFDDFFNSIDHFKSVYFESFFNKNFELVAREEAPLALDKLYYFLDTNKKINLSNFFKYKDYYILAYYEKKSKQLIMRKFTDGYY